MLIFIDMPCSNSKPLIDLIFLLQGTTVTADKRKGQVYVHQAEDSLIHFCWKDRTSGNVEDDLIIFPGMFWAFRKQILICQHYGYVFCFL